MKKSLIAVAVAVAALANARADGSAIFDGGWRVSAGGVFNSPVKAKLGFRNMPSGVPSSFVPGLSRDEARRASQGTKDGTRTTYSSGAWIDSSDAHGDGKTTWNVYLPEGTFEGDSFRLGSAEYAEVVNLGTGSSDGRHSDESAMPGVNIELSRNLHHDEEYGWGLDLAFGVMYFFQTDVFKADAASASAAYRTGRYETTIEAPDDVMDEWSWNEDGTYGAGSYEGPGPVFELGDIDTRQIANPDVIGGSAISARGDYSELELILSLRPYYDVTDWFRLYATAGLVVSRGEFDLDLAVNQNGTGFYRSRDFSEWDVYGIAGLGGQFSYKDFTLGFDFLARFLQDDIDVNDRYVHGSVERGSWLFRVMLGYEF